MKRSILLFSMALIACHCSFSQEPTKEWDAFTGVYQLQSDSTQLFKVKKEKGQLVLDVGNGQTKLVPLGGYRFKPELQRPTVVEFMKDSLGKVQQFSWIQDLTVELIKVSGEKGYSGKYQIKNNPYVLIEVSEANGALVIRQGNGSPITMQLAATDQFVYEKEGFKLIYLFPRNAKGEIRSIQVARTGPQVFVRMKESNATALYEGQDFSDGHAFGRADSLRGYLSAERSCYDVLFYALDVQVMPATKSIAGSNTIRFRAVQDFNKMQVDLFANLRIEKIMHHGHALAYTREYNAVFIQFPAMVKAGTLDSITISYAGQPRQPNINKLQGGFFWLYDKNGNPWIESVCQGLGASLWWPCKDHQADEPDSMRISITVPDSLTEISNGRLQGVTSLPGGLMRYDWYVHYPINNYNVVVNIGKYDHFSEQYINGRDTMALHYYYLSYHGDLAKKVFKQVPTMMRLFEKQFGPYPFKQDGFTIMESIYPMEHQGAVSVGAFNQLPNSDQYDTADIKHLAWHESAHEWWGNSITSKDNADMWIHEAFATWAEILCLEIFDGPQAALKYIRDQVPGNKKTIIGRYDVNDFHLGDMYPKGGRMLQTMRRVMDNDSLWFDLLRSIQQQFKYQTITTQDIESFISKKTGRNWQSFFDQYLRHTALPELVLQFKKNGEVLEVQYKWKADVAGFEMPVKVTVANNRFAFVYPTSKWKKLRIPNMQIANFAVDTDQFFIRVNKQQKDN
jgi:hypothetical protein